jgi:hypothetical protein
MRLALLAIIASSAFACDSGLLRDNQQRWREAQCDGIMDTRTRERCLKEANEKK